MDSIWLDMNFAIALIYKILNLVCELFLIVWIELSPYEFDYFHDPLFKINFASIHQIKGLTTSN